MKNKLFLFGILSLMTTIYSQVKVLTFHCNKPNYIKYQYLCLKKFLRQDFELIVMNDARDSENIRLIADVCSQFGIKCIRFEPEWHADHPLNHYLFNRLKNEKIYSHLTAFQNPDFLSLASFENQSSIRHCHLIQYALDHFGYENDDYVVILDGDAFPIRPINLKNLLSRYDIIGFKRQEHEEEIDYLWVPFIAINMPKMPNKNDLKFHVDVVNSILEDTGSHSYHYLKNNPFVRANKYPVVDSQPIRDYSSKTLKTLGFKHLEIEFIKDLPGVCNVQFGMQNRILHFNNSSFGIENHVQKEASMLKFLNKLLRI